MFYQRVFYPRLIRNILLNDPNAACSRHLSLNVLAALKKTISTWFKIPHAATVESRWGSFWVLIVCPLGGVATSKAPHKLLPWVPKELNKVNRRAYNSSYTAPTYCRPPGRKHSANNETSPAPALIIRPFCFKIFPHWNGRRSEKSSSAPCQVGVWRVFFNFGVWDCFFAPGVEMWPPKQGW